METLIIHGCGGHGKSVAANMKKRWRIIFVDDFAGENEFIFGFPVLKNIENIPGAEKFSHHIALGNLQAKAEKFAELRARGFTFPALISENAEILENAVIGDGVFIGHGAYIGPGAVIGENSIINTGAIVEHDCRIGANSHISIRAAAAGYAVIGDSVMLGAGATVIDKVAVCDNCIIGAGAVVCRDIVQSGTYVGVPAGKIKQYE